jgi:hypothetical protein
MYMRDFLSDSDSGMSKFGFCNPDGGCPFHQASRHSRHVANWFGAGMTPRAPMRAPLMLSLL